MIHALPCDDAQAGHLLAAVKSDKTDSANAIDLGELIAQGQAFKVQGHDGETVAAYVLQRQGDALWIMAAAGRADFDLTRALSQLVERQAAGYSAVGFRTERRGLVRKAERLGYVVTARRDGAYFLRKNLA